MDYYQRAIEIKEDIIKDRRYLHEHAEAGLCLPNTVEYVMNKLKEYGIEPRRCGNGVVVEIGKGGKVILLRADMDALPIKEDSGEEFSCSNGSMHACGHDFHAAMLLNAARLLKENEDELNGTVRLMFQTGEEIFKGCNDMLEAGVLDNVDAALAYHVCAGKMPIGLYMYNDKSTMMHSVDGFKITINGKGCHGAYPQDGIDPINIGVHIHLALQELIAREANPSCSSVLTIGKFSAGNAANIIPNSAVLEGTIRTNDLKEREMLVKRMKEVVNGVTSTYRGEVEIEMISEVPPLICNGDLTREMISYMEDLKIPNTKGVSDVQASASEDFAIIANKVPSAYFYLSAGYLDDRGEYPIHHPKVLFNEDVCTIGTAYYAQCATMYLKNN